MKGTRRHVAGWRVGLLMASVSMLLALAVAEIGFKLVHTSLGIDRAAIENMRIMVLEGDSVHYVPRAFTNFGLRPGSSGINALGFVGWADGHPVEKRQGLVRIACLGASTTQGGNRSGVAGSYPYQLEELLAVEAIESIEVMNFGVSGWTTAETLVNYLLMVQDYSPDIVILHHGVNDVAGRLYADYRSDYTHFRTAWTPPQYPLWQRLLVRVSDLGTWLVLHTGGLPHLRQIVVRPRSGPIRLDAAGQLDSVTAGGFRRNMETIAELVELHGGRTVFLTMPHSHVPGHTSDVRRLGLADHNRIVREMAADPGRLLADAARSFEPEVDPHRSFFRDSVHVSAEGNRQKARVAADALFAAGWLERRDP
jgi:lysophospholipase L1-like esterase